MALRLLSACIDVADPDGNEFHLVVAGHPGD
jgi:hypothetical protein